MRLMLIDAPQVEPITLAEAKQQCRVRHDHMDTRLQQLIRSARQSAELRTGRALITQRWRQAHDRACSVIKLAKWPAQSVEQVTVDGEVVPAEGYELLGGDDPRLVSRADSWQGKAVEVEFTAGHGDEPTDVPGPIVDWMLMHIAALFENSSAAVVGTITSELKFADGLLTDYMVPR
tara:strand:- start:69 stop:599 length:531 start_codon:yes stop_codon:yes gene_type:complete